MKKDGKSRYFGPYTSAGAVKDTLDLIHKLYRIRTCNRNLPRDTGKEQPLPELPHQTVRRPLPGLYFPGGLSEILRARPWIS